VMPPCPDAGTGVPPGGRSRGGARRPRAVDRLAARFPGNQVTVGFTPIPAVGPHRRISRALRLRASTTLRYSDPRYRATRNSRTRLRADAAVRAALARLPFRGLVTRALDGSSRRCRGRTASTSSSTRASP
jgi:hypothetical protein